MGFVAIILAPIGFVGCLKPTGDMLEETGSGNLGAFLAAFTELAQSMGVIGVGLVLWMVSVPRLEKWGRKERTRRLVAIVVAPFRRPPAPKRAGRGVRLTLAGTTG